MPKINFVPMATGTANDPADDVKTQMMLAKALFDDNGPERVYSTGQGLLTAGAKALGGYLMGQTVRDEQKAEDAAWNPLKELIQKDIERYGKDAPAPTTTSDAGATSTYTSETGPGFATSGDEIRSRNMTARADERGRQAVSLLTGMGYSPAAAAGIAGNLMHESGFDTGIAGDNGTAHGIAQWRGPRFVNLQRFAAQNGRDWRDFETQVRFLDHEMRTGSDAGAARAFAALQGTNDPSQAADAFMRLYERPSNAAIAQSGPLRAQYAQQLGGGDGPSGRTVTPAQNLPPAVAQLVGDPQASYAAEGKAAPARPTPSVPQPDLSPYRAQLQVAQSLMQNRRTRAIGLQMYNQAMQGIAAAQQTYRNELLRLQDKQEQRSLTREGYDRQDFRQEQQLNAQAELERQKAKRPMAVPGQSRLVDPETGREIVPANPAQGGSVEIGPDGSIKATTGVGGGKLTEQQSKDLTYHDRALGAEADLEDMEDALRSYRGRYGGDIPVIGNLLKGDAYRQAEVSAREFLSGVLRKDTGAAVTKQEFDIYGNMFLPQPGDDDKTMELKRRGRLRAIRSIKKGLGTAQVLADSRPDLFKSADEAKAFVDKNQPATPAPKAAPQTVTKQNPFTSAPPVGTIMDGHRFKGGDPADEKNWEKLR